MGGYGVVVHVHQTDEVLMRRRTVIALQEVIDDVLPVRLDVIGQTLGVGQLVQIGGEATDFLLQIAADLLKRLGLRIA